MLWEIIAGFAAAAVGAVVYLVYRRDKRDREAPRWP
jgi:hypothetical protein